MLSALFSKFRSKLVLVLERPSQSLTLNRQRELKWMFSVRSEFEEKVETFRPFGANDGHPFQIFTSTLAFQSSDGMNTFAGLCASRRHSDDGFTPQLSSPVRAPCLPHSWLSVFVPSFPPRLSFHKQVLTPENRGTPSPGRDPGGVFITTAYVEWKKVGGADGEESRT